jgi:hypothetical protein
MTPEMRRVLEVLTKYKVSLPVGALVELGILNDPAPTRDVHARSISLAEMRAIAERGGRVRWNHSGIVERVTVSTTNPHGFVAQGHYTRTHYVAPRPVYFCTPYNEQGVYLPAIGDPYAVPLNLVRSFR